MVHDVVFEAGHTVNVTPEKARGGYELRARTIEDLAYARRRVQACLEGAALATGAGLELASHGADFADLRQDEYLTAAYTRAVRALGREPVDRRGEVMAPPPTRATSPTSCPRSIRPSATTRRALTTTPRPSPATATRRERTVPYWTPRSPSPT
ncbi:hypothetical protein [Streptomyces sp. enrichment culture]|uniref:hypothetical protein n=1 Tax=Streptomyces sp. enrichment culture TaxID=1795815 RepID=UPI003F54642F